jgi:predicted phage tail protein
MLKTIKLYGSLKEITGHGELEAHVTNTGDCMSFLLMNWPELRGHMRDQYYQVLTDGNNVGEEQLDYPFSKEIKIVPVITGAGENFGRILLGAVLIGAAFATGGGSLAWTGAGFGAAAGVPMTSGLAMSAALGNIGLALALGGVANILFPPAKEEEREDDPRISFAFGGTPNVVRAGTTHPIVYGEIFTGSTVISASVKTEEVQA